MPYAGTVLKELNKIIQLKKTRHCSVPVSLSNKKHHFDYSFDLSKVHGLKFHL